VDACHHPTVSRSSVGAGWMDAGMMQHPGQPSQPPHTSFRGAMSSFYGGRERTMGALDWVRLCSSSSFQCFPPLSPMELCLATSTSQTRSYTKPVRHQVCGREEARIACVRSNICVLPHHAATLSRAEVVLRSSIKSSISHSL
jgi:hypothetical protein